nr:alpha/beta hydrolase [Pseudenhygromyxa sp. WMMC2535]
MPAFFALAVIGCAAPCPTTEAPACPCEAEAGEPSADAAEPSQAEPSAGLDAMLSGYDYPFPVETFSAEVQGQVVSIAYMDIEPSEPNGATVTLLHGKNFSGAYWADTAKALSAQGFRVVIPDQLGFGKSSKPIDVQYSFQMLSSLTLALLDALEIEQTALVGHSMGGMVGTRMALMFPERVSALALVNPIGLEDWKREVPYVSVDEWKARNLKATPESIKAYMQTSYFDGQWKPEYDPLLDIQAGWATGPDRERIATVSALHYDMIFTQPVVHEFPDLRVPTLLIIGQRDRTALNKGAASPEVAATLGDYPALGRAAERAIPKATLVEIDGVGHVPQLEAWAPYIQALTSYLLEHGAQAEG